MLDPVSSFLHLFLLTLHYIAGSLSLCDSKLNLSRLSKAATELEGKLFFFFHHATVEMTYSPMRG